MIEITTYSPTNGLDIQNMPDDEIKHNNPNAYDFCFNELNWTLSFKKASHQHEYKGNIPNVGNKAIMSLQLLLFNLEQGYVRSEDFDFLGPDDAVTGGSPVSAMLRRLRKLLKDNGSGDQSDNFIQTVKSPYLIRFNPNLTYCWINRVPQ